MSCAKRLNRPRCSFGCWGGWVQGTCITWGVDAQWKGNFLGVWMAEKLVSIAFWEGGWKGKLCKNG